MMNTALLQLAQTGDQVAFTELIEPYRRELHLHCYRLLGSVTDADDLLQETMVAAWQSLAGFAGRASLRTWLYRIATNRCLNALRDAKRRPPPVPIPPFVPPQPSRHSEVTWLQPYPDVWLKNLTAGPAERVETRESIGLAFVAALQRLPPRQMAATVLCDVLGFPVAEAATMLGSSPTAIKGLRQRARAALHQRHSESKSSGPTAGSRAEYELAQRFADAFADDDTDAVIELLTDDAWLRMPPAPHEYQGRPAIRAFLQASAAGRAGQRLALLPTQANRQPAFICYLRMPHNPVLQPSGLIVVEMANNAITTITRFLDSGLPAMFEKPMGPLMATHR